jgi:hypothetical protein
MIKLRQLARLHNLPFTLHRGQEHLYEVLRNGVRGGPSNVHNRCNEKGKTTTKKLEFINSKIIMEETKDENCEYNVMTHCTIFDFNSLYPFRFGSIK